MTPEALRKIAQEVAVKPDWRAVLDALRLPQAEARALRVEVLRRRVFGAGARPR